MTAKAIRATITAIDGEYANVETMWIPRSLSANGRIRKVTEDDGTFSFEFTCEMPSWWVAKLDTRPGWAKRGERMPTAQRPW